MGIIALVGRPNVGKSTLFNRLAGKKLALIDDQPGVTRDYKTAPISVDGLTGTIMDTAGLTDSKTGIEQSMTKQSLRALEMASALVFMVDGASGVTPLDMEFARELRKLQKPVILVANKADRNDARAIQNETHRLGFGDVIPVSASHGHGIEELLDRIVPFLNVQEAVEAKESDDEADEEKALRLAIVGRPNAGKSTLLNALLNEERSLTSDVAGTTRDPVSVEWEYEGRQIRLVDTAGMRRRSRVIEKIEVMAVEETRRIIRLAELVIVVIDATMQFDQQDLIIIQNVFDEGRAMVLVINKWDKIEDKKAAESYIQDILQRALPFVRGIPVITMSATRGGKSLQHLMKAVFEQHKVWNRRINTGKLNRWLEDMIGRNPPPLARGPSKPYSLHYADQSTSADFCIVGNATGRIAGKL